MARLLNAVVCLSLASGALSASLSLPNYAQLRDRASGASPCAQVRDLSAAWLADPANHGDPLIPAELAYNCLNSVPFRKDVAVTIVDQVVLYSKFASTVSMAKNPPPEYRQNVLPPYDLWAALASVREKAASSSYKSEYEFGMALLNAVRGMHDDALHYVMDIVTNAFIFLRKSMIVSVSVDGRQLPEIYDWDDLVEEKYGRAKYKPSAITHINGQPATAWLEKDSKTYSIKDPDAAYNGMMRSLAGVHAGRFATANGNFGGGGDYGGDYPGPTTTYRFANGTTTVSQNLAVVLIPFDGVTDGKSLADLWFPQPATPQNSTPQNSTQQNSTQQNSTQQDSSEDDVDDFLPSDNPPTNFTGSYIPPIGYPPPDFFLVDWDAGGYFLGGQYSDVAVLAIGTFGNRGAKVFQDATVNFITKAKALGKKKLIIDISAAFTGDTPLAYDLFKILFPRGDTYATADRFRAFNITEFVMDTSSQLDDYFPRTSHGKNSSTAYYNMYFMAQSFDGATDMDINGKPFTNWTQKFGPDLLQNGDTFSSLFRWNFTDEDVDYFTRGVGIHGFRSLAEYAHAPQPFNPSDIIIVSDGQAGGPASAFAELMRKQGVKFVAVGGRPRRGKMQAIGRSGTATPVDAEFLRITTSQCLRILDDPNEVDRLNKTDINQFFDRTLFTRVSDWVSIPFRNSYRANDKSNIPVHFKYTPADCRMFYTKKMALDVSAVWEAAADSAWSNKCHCIDGSLRSPGQKSSLHRRELNVEELAHTAKIQAWKDGLTVDDFITPKNAKAAIGNRLSNTKALGGI